MVLIWLVFIGINTHSPLILAPISTPQLSYIGVSPIFIDDNDPNNNWETFVSNNPWVFGSGTFGDPYYMFGMYIDASGTDSSCIRIQNSGKFFYIQDSILFNTRPNEINAGIMLINVTHGTIGSNEVYDNSYDGIYVYNSSVIISQNNIHDNGGTGIFIYNSASSLFAWNTIHKHEENGIRVFNSSTIYFENNNISYNIMSGISLGDSTQIEINDNIISNNKYGIKLERSDHNLIDGNNISNNEEYGVYLRQFSDFNQITYNSFQDNPRCILIGDTCVGTYLDNGELCVPYGFDENPPPDDNNNTDNPEDDTNNNNNDTSFILDPVLTYSIISGLILSFLFIFIVKLKRGRN